uniref:Uncharacterized protein n=1 Tax=Panagrolaimus sp. PS1159 TaxID=55785 RepID=A0AC35FR65_9BILA
MKYLDLRVVTFIATGINLIAYVALFFLAFYSFPQNLDEVRLQEIKYDSFFENFDEPSLIFIPVENIQWVAIFAFFLVLLLIGLAFAVVFVFINLVLSSTTVTSTKMQKPLIVSSIIQISLTCGFLILPILFILAALAFQIPNSAGWCTFCICIVCSFSVIDFIATLYFVAPYRRFVKKLIDKILKRPQQAEVHVITKIPSQAKSVRVDVFVSVITN